MAAPAPVPPLDEVGALLAELEALGVALHGSGERLRYDAPRSVLAPELLDRLREHRWELGALVTPPPGVEATGPAGFGQDRMHRFTHRTTDPSTFTIAVRFALCGPLDRGALGAALDALVARHPALRTRYRPTRAGLRQEVLVPGPVDLRVEPARERELDGALLRRAREPFDLDGEPAFRCVLFDLAPERCELLLAVHHGIADGWSVAVIVRDLAELYRARIEARPPRLPPRTGDMIAFARAERRAAHDSLAAAAVRRWADGLGPVPELPLLPTDRPRSARRTDAGAVHVRVLPPTLVAEVGAVARRRGSTTFAVLLAAFVRLQHELTGSATAAVGCPVANRGDADTADAVGLFSQAHWLVVPGVDTAPAGELLDRTTAAVHHLLAHQAVPAVVVDRELGAPFDRPEGKVQLSLFNQALPTLRLPGLAPAPPAVVSMTGARVDQGWLLGVLPDGGLRLDVEYAVDLFDASTVAAAVDRWLVLLREVLDHLARTGGGPVRASTRDGS